MNLWRRLRRKRIPLSELNTADIMATKSSLEGSVDAWEGVAHVFTAMVAVGLVIEYRGPFVDFIRTHDWRYIENSIGGVSVTLGVAGELLAGFRATAKDGLLREANSLLASRSAETIAASNERIAEMSLKIEEEQSRAVELNLQIEGEKLARLRVEEKVEQERVARARIEGENALRQIEILKLRKALADRTLTPEEFGVISTEMLPFAGLVFRITTDSDQSTEQSGFGRWVANALVNAKWSEERHFIDSRTLRPLVGMSIQATNGIQSQNAAKALASALNRLGHVVEFNSSSPDGWLWHSPSHPSGSHERIWLRIGSKPNPPVAD